MRAAFVPSRCWSLFLYARRTPLSFIIRTRRILSIIMLSVREFSLVDASLNFKMISWIFEIENSRSCELEAWQIRLHCEECCTMARKKISSSDYCALLWRTMNVVRAQERVERAIEKVYIYEKYPFRGNNNIFGINARWQKFSIEMRTSAIVAYQKIRNFAQFHVCSLLHGDMSFWIQNIHFHALLFQEVERYGNHNFTSNNIKKSFIK